MATIERTEYRPSTGYVQSSIVGAPARQSVTSVTRLSANHGQKCHLSTTSQWPPAQQGATITTTQAHCGNIISTQPRCSNIITTTQAHCSNIVTTQPRCSNIITTTQAPGRTVVSSGGGRAYSTHHSQTMISAAPMVRTSVTSVNGPSRFIEERYVGERVVGVTENRLESRVVSATVPELRTIVNEVETWEEEPIVQERIVEKQVEMIVEKKVKRETYVDVPYDVIVERPIEKIIEKEIEIEKIMEREFHKTIEVPVERIVEIPVERIVHMPVEVQRTVEVPVERVVERQVNDYIDNVIYHDNQVDCDVKNLHMYPDAIHLPTEVRVQEHERVVERPIFIDNIINKVVDVPIEKLIEVPVERVVERPVETIVENTIYMDNIIEKEVAVPVERIINKPVEIIVEKPVYIENIIEKPVPIEVIREETVEVPIEHVIEKPVFIDNIIEKPVEVIIENPVPIEQIVEVPKAVNIETNIPLDKVEADNYDVVKEIPVQIDTVTKLPIEYIVRKDVPVPVENVVTINMPVCRKDVHERVIDRPVEWERIVQRAIPVEKIVEVEVERVTENPMYVEKIIEKPVVHDRVIEQKYEVIVENIVEVPVEKIISIPVKTYTQAPVEQNNYFEKDVNVVSTVIEPVQGNETEMNYEVDDELLAQKTAENIAQAQTIANTNAVLKGEIQQLSVNHLPGYNMTIQTNAQLRSQLSELESRLNIVEKDKDRLQQAVGSRVVQNISYTVPDPSIHSLASELQGEIAKNNGLIRKADAYGQANASQTVVVTEVVEPMPVTHIQRASTTVIHQPATIVQQVAAPATVTRVCAPMTTTHCSVPMTSTHIVRGGSPVRMASSQVVRGGSPVCTQTHVVRGGSPVRMGTSTVVRGGSPIRTQTHVVRGGSPVRMVNSTVVQNSSHRVIQGPPSRMVKTSVQMTGGCNQQVVRCCRK